jgi:hypothetical protein
MAQVVTVEKKEPLKPNLSKQNNTVKRPPLFRKMNYILMVVGVIILIIGYILFSGGKAPSNTEFNPKIFNNQRLIVAPTLMLIGLVTEIFAIMSHPRQKKKTEPEVEK